MWGISNCKEYAISIGWKSVWACRWKEAMLKAWDNKDKLMVQEID